MEPAKKKGLGCLGWGLLVTVLLLILVGGCSFLIFQASRGPTEAANSFLGLVRDGQYQEAADLAGTRTNNGAPCSITANGLASDFAGLSSYTVFGFGAAGEGGVGGAVTLDGQDTGVAIEMVEESGDWKPCSYEVGDNASVEFGN